jgi:predicted DsbA family dithiol-disulfide isomerase
MPVQIEVISDVVCPWCYIGKRRLEAALGQVKRQVQVVWRPFQLNPGLPEEGMDRVQYVRDKFGDAGGKIYARVQAVGAAAGIAFAFDRIRRQPNTLAAHQLIALATPGLQQDAMCEALFRAYFLEGEDLTSRATLLRLAQSAGLDEGAVQGGLGDPAARQAVLAQDHAARALGVEGVPFFIFERRFAVSGAQEAEVLAQAIERAAQPAEAA